MVNRHASRLRWFRFVVGASLLGGCSSAPISGHPSAAKTEGADVVATPDPDGGSPAPEPAAVDPRAGLGALCDDARACPESANACYALWSEATAGFCAQACTNGCPAGSSCSSHGVCMRSCATNGECDPGTVCTHDHVCLPHCAAAPGFCPPDTFCAASGECATVQACASKICYSPASCCSSAPFCTGASSTGARCRGTCGQASEACTSSSDCCAGLSCTGGICH